MDMRSPLGKARGLGSAHEGAAHRWAQQVTAMALVPLSIWFVVSMIPLAGADYGTFKAWAGEHGNSMLLILFVVTMFHHAQLGVRMVIEDYIHNERIKQAGLIGTRFIAVVAGLSAVMAVLRLAFV